MSRTGHWLSGQRDRGDAQDNSNLKGESMAENSGIGWTDHTQNFWWGCHKASEECTHCYIDGIMRRAGRVPFAGPMRTVNWSNPHRWERQAQEQGRRFRIFTCSMSDFFHPGADGWRDEAWEVIRQCPSLDWFILTKRPELIADRLPVDWGNGYRSEERRVGKECA